MGRIAYVASYCMLIVGSIVNYIYINSQAASFFLSLLAFSFDARLLYLHNLNCHSFRPNYLDFGYMLAFFILERWVCCQYSEVPLLHVA
jgi:hypothetical protein